MIDNHVFLKFFLIAILSANSSFLFTINRERQIQLDERLCEAVVNGKRTAVLKTILNEGANINAYFRVENRQNEEWIFTFKGATPLIIAIQLGRWEVAKFLISKGASVILYDKERELTPLRYIAFFDRRDNIEETEVVLGVANLIIDQDSNCLNQNNIFEGTALHIASCAGFVELVYLLLYRDVEINVVDFNYCTPLDLALNSKKYFEDRLETISFDYSDLLLSYNKIIQALLEGGGCYGSEIDSMHVEEICECDSEDREDVGGVSCAIS